MFIWWPKKTVMKKGLDDARKKINLEVKQFEVRLVEYVSEASQVYLTYCNVNSEKAQMTSLVLRFNYA